jgi:peptidoglycan/LPS O-acetylase OafA/YrhL
MSEIAAVSSDAPAPSVAPPPGNPRFPEIDSIRAIAVLIVLLYHVAAVTGALATPFTGDFLAVAGADAISLLFLTSGFLLYRPFVRARAAGRPLPSRRRYLRRRMLRILPAYWFALTVLAIYPGIRGPFTGDWWRYYFFLQLYSHRTLNIGIPVAWTLSVEMSFYLILPIWATLIRRVRIGSGDGAWFRGEMVALALLATLGIVIQVLASRLTVSQLVADSVLGNCTWIALGMGLAATSAYTTQRRSEPAFLRWLGTHPGRSLCGAFVCCAVATLILQPDGLLGILLSLETKQPYSRTLAGIALTFGALVFLVAPTMFGDRTRRSPGRLLLSWPPLMRIGVIAYGVYLWHLAVVSLLSESSDPVHFSATGLGLAQKIHFAPTPILFVISLAGTLVLAAFSYRFVELPFLRLKER